MFELAFDLSELEAALTAADRKLDAGLARAVDKACHAGADAARTRHHFKNRSGTLERSIGGGLLNVYRSGDQTVVVGALVAEAPYAGWVNDGTRPHTIEAKRKRALRWYSPGGVKFATKVRHPGTAPDGFMTIAEIVAADTLEREVNILAETISASFA